jgi:hypothetical protein
LRNLSLRRYANAKAVWCKDKIWVAGGHARPLNSEVWNIEIPQEWFGQE